MMREVFEKGLASTVAKWMLEGSADALIERVAAAGVLKPEEVAALRQETRAHLEKVRDEGAPYAELVGTALREVGKNLPLGQLAGAGLAAASQLPLRDLASSATRVALGVAARAAQSAAERAQNMADAMQPAAEQGETPAESAEKTP